jgi:hypothetical protein
MKQFARHGIRLSRELKVIGQGRRRRKGPQLAPAPVISSAGKIMAATELFHPDVALRLRLHQNRQSAGRALRQLNAHDRKIA